MVWALNKGNVGLKRGMASQNGSDGQRRKLKTDTTMMHTTAIMPSPIICDSASWDIMYTQKPKTNTGDSKISKAIVTKNTKQPSVPLLLRS